MHTNEVFHFQSSADGKELKTEAIRKHFESFGYKPIKVDIQTNVTITCHARAVSKSKDHVAIGCETALCVMHMDI